MIDISIIIPVYNTADYLEKCIESVLEQTLRNIEIILIDDNSTDTSYEVLKNLEKQDKRVKIYCRHVRKGAGAARNTGILNAIGGYLYFLDSDDFLCNVEALEKLNSKAKSLDADVVLFKYNFYNKGKFINQKLKVWEDIEENYDINRNYKITELKEFLLIPAYPWNKLYKRKFLLDNKIQCSETFVHNDITLSVNSLIAAEKIALHPHEYITHRISSEYERLTNDSSNNRLDLFTTFKEVDTFIEKHDISYEIKEYINKFKWDAFNWGKLKITKKGLWVFVKSYHKQLIKTSKRERRGFTDNHAGNRIEKIKYILLIYVPKLYWAMLYVKRKKRE